MNINELKDKLETMKDMMEENWLEDEDEDEDGMEEYEVVAVYEKTDIFEEVLDLLENVGDELDIAHRLSH